MTKSVFVIIHSCWGHVKTLGDEIVKGLKSEGVEATLYRVPETLPKEVMEKMHAQAFEEIPVITPEKLTEADGFIFGFGVRYGLQPAQMKAFWDATGSLWQKGALAGKFGGVFTSTAGQTGGQEVSIMSFLPHFAHHGIIYVPLGYADPTLFQLNEVCGGSPWGAGTIAGGDGSRKVSANELSIALTQGKNFAKTLNRLK